MPRASTGQVLELSRRRGRTFALRFRAYGKRQYVTLGAEVTTRKQADEELANILADVRRGMWTAPAPAPAIEPPVAEQTFHEFASEWLVAREAEGLAEKTLVAFHWSIERHLLPFFARHLLHEITAQEVDRYKIAKAKERAQIADQREAAVARGERYGERGLSNASINHTLRHLTQIMETAVEYGLVVTNPAGGKRRRLKPEKPSRPWVELEQLMALLDATDGLGLVLLTLLAGAGLRIGEALSLRWEHVDLGTGTLVVVAAKTEKGLREVHLTPAVRETLALWRADASFTAPDQFVLHTSSGRKHYASNLRRDVLYPSVKAANDELVKKGISPIGAVTFHGLRRTYASLRCACGDDIRYAADQLGHEDPRFTLRVYAQATKRRERLARPQREAFDRAIEWALMGTGSADEPLLLPHEATKNPA